MKCRITAAAIMAALLAAWPGLAFADLNMRTSAQTWDVNTTAAQKHQNVVFYRAESFRLDLSAKSGGNPLDLSATNLVTTWEVVDWDTMSNCWLVVTGELVSATNGQVRFEADPDQTEALEAGTYRGFAWAWNYDGTGTNLVKAGVLAAQRVEVLDTAQGRYYGLHPAAPYPWSVVTNYYTRAEVDARVPTAGVMSVACGASNILSGAVDLAGQITTHDLRDLTVATEDISDLAITESKISGGSVTHGKIGAGAVWATNVTASGNLGISNGSFYVRGIHNQTWAKPSTNSTMPVYSDGAVTWQSLGDLGGGDMLAAEYATGAVGRVDRAHLANYAGGMYYLTTILPLTNAGVAGQVLARSASGTYWTDQASGGIGDMEKAVYVAGTGIVRRAYGLWTNAVDNPNTASSDAVLTIGSTAGRPLIWRALSELGGGDMMSNYWTSAGLFDLAKFPVITENYIGSGAIKHAKVATGSIGATALSNDVIKTTTSLSGGLSGSLPGSAVVVKLRDATLPLLNASAHMCSLVWQTNTAEWIFVPSGFLSTNLESLYLEKTAANTSNWDTAYGWGDHASAGYATGTPLYAYAESDPAFAAWSNAIGSQVATGTPLYEVDLTPYATGTPLYAYAETDPAFAAWSNAVGSQVATGTPLYEVDLTPYATGTPLYAYTETDPAFAAWSNAIGGQVATGTPLYELDLTPYATGTPLYAYAETDPAFAAWSNAVGSQVATGTPLYEVDLTPYATGTPLYAYAETDPAFAAWSNAVGSQVATGTPLYEVDLTPYATGTPLYAYAETDPAWQSWLTSEYSNSVITNSTLLMTGETPHIGQVQVGDGLAITGGILHATGTGIDTNASYTFAAGTTQTFDRIGTLEARVAIGGKTSHAVTNNEVIIGFNNTNAGPCANAVIIGSRNRVSDNSGIAIGYEVEALSSYSIGIGRDNYGSDQTITIGYQTYSYPYSVAIGNGSTSGRSGGNPFSVAIGPTAWAGGLECVAVGINARTYDYGVAVGRRSGYNAVSGSGHGSVAVGNSALAESGCFGYLATAVGSSAMYQSVTTNSTGVGSSALIKARGYSLVGVGCQAATGVTGDYITVIGDYSQRRYTDDYLTSSSLAYRAVSSETAQIAGDLVLYDPYIDNLGAGYTNTTSSGKSITFISGTNAASITVDFDNQFFVFAVNGTIWTNKP